VIPLAPHPWARPLYSLRILPFFFLLDVAWFACFFHSRKGCFFSFLTLPDGSYLSVCFRNPPIQGPGLFFNSFGKLGYCDVLHQRFYFSSSRFFPRRTPRCFTPDPPFNCLTRSPPGGGPITMAAPPKFPTRPPLKIFIFWLGPGSQWDNFGLNPFPVQGGLFFFLIPQRLQPFRHVRTDFFFTFKRIPSQAALAGPGGVTKWLGGGGVWGGCCCGGGSFRPSWGGCCGWWWVRAGWGCVAFFVPGDFCCSNPPLLPLRTGGPLFFDMSA